MKKIDLKLDFDAIRLRIEHQKNRYKPGVWADMVGVSKNVVSNVHGRTKQKPSLEYIIAVSLITGKSVDYYLWGKESEKEISQPPSDNITKVVIEHQDIIKQFKDPELGKDLNKELILIQNTDKSLFKSTVQSIRAAGDMARVMKGLSNRNQDKRGSDQDGNGSDRRKKKQPWKGPDRRKNGTDNQ
ncbi:hypothetical protein [Desulfobacula phenolica]|uniref:Uncharacterized protein n=1 Tax=Desulfobacula phenolica TaxID=90732 RepID=A0A1H2H6R0_9BACT|nr:hypothetical protein [Desulfobacula phenolica]SDU27429.1 hypothetical protein SAMN04487931_10671 [Desulfobacula phenolica]